MSKRSRIIRIAAGIIFICMLIVHLVLLLLGRSWFLTTLLFYPAIGFLIIYILKFTFFRKCETLSRQWTFKKIKFSVLAVLLLVLFLDLGTRFFTKKYRSYSEINYGLFYHSPFYDGFSDFKKYILGNYKPGNRKTHIPDSEYIYESSDFKFLHKFNEYGLRERKKLDSLILNKKVILTIGDSFTEGVGTNQDSTWQRILENRLNNTYNDNNFVINAGISGFDPCDGYELYNNLRNVFNPDYVIFSIGSNDVLDLIQRDKMDVTDKSDNFFQPVGYYFYSWSYLFRVFSSWAYDYPEFFMNEDDLRMQSHKSSEIIKNILISVSVLAEKDSCKTIIVFYPVKHEVITGRYNSPELQLLIDELKENPDILVVDLLSFFNETSQSLIIPADVLYWPRDGHLTPPGYRMWAEILFTDIQLSGIK